MKNRYKPVSKYMSYENSFKRTKRTAQTVIGVCLLVCLMMCSGCSTTAKSNNIKEHCLESVVTYQDLVECAIKLNQLQGN